MLDSSDLREPAGIGGHEGEGPLGMLLVLGQVERDAAHGAPDRVDGVEEAVDPPGRGGRRAAGLRIDLLPEGVGPRGVEELQSPEGWRALDPVGPGGPIRRRDRREGRVLVARRLAERGQVAAGEGAAEGQRGRQGLAMGRQAEEALGRRNGKGLADAGRSGVGQREEAGVLLDEAEAPPGQQGQFHRDGRPRIRDISGSRAARGRRRRRSAARSRPPCARGPRGRSRRTSGCRSAAPAPSRGGPGPGC